MGIIRETDELADINWENLGFGLVPTDYMYISKCARDGVFTKGKLEPFGNIELNPSAGVLNYGQVSSLTTALTASIHWYEKYQFHCGA